MNEVLESQEFEKAPKRPAFLLVLCILSFISIGLSFITALFSLITGPSSEEEILELKVEFTQQMSEMDALGAHWASEIFRKLIHITEATNAAHYMNTFTTILILLVGALGVFMMLKGKKLGFHFYIIYSLLTAVQLYLFVDPRYIPTFLVVTSLLFSGIFVLLYGLNLKHMK